MPDGEVYHHVDALTKLDEWKIFEEYLRRNREKLMVDMVLSTDTPTLDRIRGRIKSLDFILALSNKYGV